MNGINFKFEGNQKAWLGFYGRFISRYTGNGDPRMSINQYKPITLALESFVDGELSTMTVENWNQAEQAKPEKINFLRSMLMDCVTNNEIKLSKDVMLAILPEQYKAFVSKIFE